MVLRSNLRGAAHWTLCPIQHTWCTCVWYAAEGAECACAGNLCTNCITCSCIRIRAVAAGRVCTETTRTSALSTADALGSPLVYFVGGGGDVQLSRGTAESKFGIYIYIYIYIYINNIAGKPYLISNLGALLIAQ